MSDFINRRLEAEGGENALKDALRGAIDAEFNPNGTKGEASLSEVNHLLGRKMRVVAFKWMDHWDI